MDEEGGTVTKNHGAASVAQRATKKDKENNATTANNRSNPKAADSRKEDRSAAIGEEEYGSAPLSPSSSSSGPPHPSSSPSSANPASTLSLPSSSSSSLSPSSSSADLTVALEYLQKALSSPSSTAILAMKKTKMVGKGLVALQAATAASGAAAIEAMPEHKAATEFVTAWRADLKLGVEVDAQSFRDDKWYSGEIVGVDHRGSCWVVKFKRFSVKHNEIYSKTGNDLFRLWPVGSHTGKLMTAPKRPRSKVVANTSSLIFIMHLHQQPVLGDK